MNGHVPRNSPFQNWKSKTNQRKHVVAEVCTKHKDDKRSRLIDNDKQQRNTAKIA